MNTQVRLPAVLLAALIATSSVLFASPGRGLVGETQTYEVARGDTLTLVAARFGVDTAVLAKDNGLKTSAKLEVGDVLEIDNRHIVPAGMDDGIIINLPQRRLFLFRGGVLKESYPVAVGSGGWRTPRGDFHIEVKEVDPTWNVPKSIQAEMAREGKRVVTAVPPGPNNPLGTRWIQIAPRIGIHGTNAPSSIFKYTTHGCIRMATEDVEHLFELVNEGDPVSVIYEPILVARDGRDVFVEVHRDPYGLGGASRSALVSALTAIDPDLASHPEIDRVLEAREGRAVSLRELTEAEPEGARDRR